MDIKLCVACGTELPLLRRSDRRYCGVGCRVRAHKIRARRGAKQQRPGEKARGTARSFLGLALSAVAVEALRREASQAREHADRDRTALELEQQAASDLRAEAERAREQANRDRAALEHERRAASDLRAEAERAREQANRDRAALEHEQRATADLRIEAQRAREEWAELWTQHQDLREEFAKDNLHFRLKAAAAAEQHRLAEIEIARLLAERHELREQLEDYTERCGQLLRREEVARRALAQATEEGRQNEFVLRQALAEAKERSLRRKQQLAQAQQQLGLLADQYEDLEIKYSEVEGRFATEYRSLLANVQNQLIAEYRGLLADQEQRYLQSAQNQERALATAHQYQHADYYEVQGDNDRLKIECGELQEQVAELKEKVARLKVRVKSESPQLPPPSRPAPREEDESMNLEVEENIRPRSRLKTAGYAALGVAAAALVIEGVHRAEDSRRALAATQHKPAARLPAGRELSPSRLLPSGR